MAKEIAGVGRVASRDSAGSMVTGLVEPAWSQEEFSGESVILQLGSPIEELGGSMGLSRAISRSIGIEDPKIITIDSGSSL